MTLLVVPLVFLFRVSLLPPGGGAPLEGPWTIDSYRTLVDGYYLRVFWRTFRVAVLTTSACLLLGYPLALSLRGSRGRGRSLKLALILSPLFVSVVVRAYGWILLLGSSGPINALLRSLLLMDRPLRLLYSETAVVVVLTEALLPFMALSIASVLEGVDPELENAARGLGDSPRGTFLRVTLPLSAPGAVAGSMLVFLVSLSSYATPALIGGSRFRVAVTEIVTQVTAVFNWPLAAALSITLLSIAVIGSLLLGGLRSRHQDSGAA